MSGVRVPFSYSVLVGKVWEINELGEFGRRAKCWAESANCDRVVTVGHSSMEKVPCIKHLRICLPLSTGRRKKLLVLGWGSLLGRRGDENNHAE